MEILKVLSKELIALNLFIVKQHLHKRSNPGGTKYSRVRNKRTGGNKHTGGIFSPKKLTYRPE